jgi:peptidoglycan hydrolase CwlO-like protein
LRRALVVALVLAAVLVMPANAFAAKKSKVVTLTVEQQAQLDAMQADFGTKLADYLTVTRELHRTEDEVSQVTSAIAQGEAKVELARSALTTRAVELYRTPQVGLLEALLGARSVADLLKKLDYLELITSRDAQLLRTLRLAQTEEAWLQESLQIRVAQLMKVQAEADKQQKDLLKQLAEEQARAAAMNQSFAPGTDQSQLTTEPTGGDPGSNEFNRRYVVSEANFRNGSAMTAADIQAFLDKQTGALKNYRGKDHYGVTKSAAEMISDACIKFNINPKTMLATLQKEQSLLTAKHPSQSQMDWALGAGKADTFTTYSMKGFGNQIYWGAQKFDKNARDWHVGSTEPVDGNKQICDNAGTFAQYRYTPHYSGVMSFWTIYWRYFGNPVG